MHFKIYQAVSSAVHYCPTFSQLISPYILTIASFLGLFLVTEEFSCYLLAHTLKAEPYVNLLISAEFLISLIRTLGLWQDPALHTSRGLPGSR